MPSFDLSNGQLSISFLRAMIGKNDCASGHDVGLRVQIYWPVIRFRHRPDQRDHRELFIQATTVLRVVTENDYCGVGAQLLGFGAAADYQSR